MAWTPRTSRGGLEYGGSASSFYWNSNLNPNARYTDCLPNCTTYAYGRQLEQGRPKPVTSIHNAGSWQYYVNRSEGWDYQTYNVNTLSVGDIVEWIGHLAVVEAIIGGVPYISNSVYTGDNGRAYDPPDSTTFSKRTPSIIGGSTLQDVSNWAINKYPNRFFSYSTLASCPWVSGSPIGVLHYRGSEPTPTTPSGRVVPSSVSARVKTNEKYVDITMDVFMDNIPVGEVASGGYTQPDIFERIYNTGWIYTPSVSGYQNASKSQTIRYTRQSRQKQTITSALLWDKDFSNGSVHIRLPITIEVDAGGGAVMFLNPSIGSIDIR